MKLFFQVVTTDIILQKTVCPLCIELRASAVQVGFSVLYPTVLSPLAGFAVSNFVPNREVNILGKNFYSCFRLLQSHILQSSFTDHSVCTTILSLSVHTPVFCLSLKVICGMNT
jgi:hypothetical protein